VTLGIMSKNNEIVAIKASGISMYRLAVPLLLAGLALAVTMIVLDDTYLPYASQRQDALRNQIKGKPPQTYTHPSAGSSVKTQKSTITISSTPRRIFWRTHGAGNRSGDVSGAATHLCIARAVVGNAKGVGTRR